MDFDVQKVGLSGDGGDKSRRGETEIRVIACPTYYVPEWALHQSPIEVDGKAAGVGRLGRVGFLDP
jgi:hypothetical protein